MSAINGQALSGLTPLAQKNREVIANGLTTYMMVLLHESFEKNGIQVRQDARINVARALAEVLKPIDEISQHRIVTRLIKEGRSILTAVNMPDNLVTVYAGLADAVVRGAERGETTPLDLALVTGVILEEVRMDPSDFGGMDRIREAGSIIDNEMRSRGWWVLR